MHRPFLIIAFLSILMQITHAQSKQDNMEQSEAYALVIHGGAGTILKKNMTPELEAAYLAKLTEALEAGYKILQSGGSSMDAVENTIRVMEDSELFNAGKGAVFTNEGKNEMDASIMDGKTLNAGAVGAVTIIKNPISAARKVLEESPHVMLIGAGADDFAKKMQLETVDPKYFFNERRWQQLQKIRNTEKQQLDHSDDKGLNLEKLENNKFGTVGAAALDQHGNLAAGTSTGGMTNKRYGRVGDSPIIGAGTYADNQTCAISCTGHGEFFIRGVVAYDIAALMDYRSMSITQAANEVIHGKLKKMGGQGGAIGVDKSGNIMMDFNTPGMYRGFVRSDGKIEVFIYQQ